MALESLSLLCGAGAGRRLTDDVVAGDSFLERISLTLQQDLRLQKVLRLKLYSTVLHFALSGGYVQA